MQLIDINVFTYSLIQSLNRGEIAIEDGTKRAAAFINYLLKIGDVKGAMLVARVWLYQDIVLCKNYKFLWLFQDFFYQL